MRINIPFKMWSIEKILKKQKSSTSRYEKLGNVGDDFFIQDKCYVFDFVGKLPLWIIRDELYRSEGCDTKQDFELVWMDIHPKRGFKPMDEVWYHHFIESS
jgi:hypothetical protein